MSKKRVDSDSLSDLKRLADDYWQSEIEDARESFDMALPPNTDRTYATKKIEKKRLVQAQLSLLREMAKHRAGMIHESGSNTSDEKREYQRMTDVLKQARKALGEDDDQ